MNSFRTRVISALIAVGLLALIIYFFQVEGLRFVILLVVLIGTLELTKILFTAESSRTNKILFFVFLLTLYLLSSAFPRHSAVFYVCISILFFSVNLAFRGNHSELNSIAQFQARSNLGFLYMGLLPSFADRILNLNHGMTWFGVLLAVVFTGDTLAYGCGMLWGNKKIMPNISPKKTVVGAIGGLAGSTIAAGASCVLLPHVPFFILVVMGLVAGTFSQSGDMFESLLKRVADVKDSGSFMPGHGGVLDRVDGVLFAVPFVYLTASFFETVVPLH